MARDLAPRRIGPGVFAFGLFQGSRADWHPDPELAYSHRSNRDIAEQGVNPWDAVREAARRRTRPILLTAAAASLVLIPISREVFWGPMAHTIMGGVISGRVLTLLFLRALYAGLFRINEPQDQ